MRAFNKIAATRLTEVMACRHECFRVSEGKQRYLVKFYASHRSLRSELLYLRAFSKRGFRVAGVHCRSWRRRAVVFEYLEGRCSDDLGYCELERCVELLATIHRAFPCRSSDSLIRPAYLGRLQQNITRFAREGNMTVDHEGLRSRLAMLEDVFVPGIFKDAKPSNFVLADEVVQVIDLDYVRKSFHLADVAQLLRYAWAVHRMDPMPLVRLYARMTGTLPGYAGQLHDCFSLAMVNSHLSALGTNPHIPARSRTAFRDQAKRLLQDLSILAYA